MTTTDSTKTPAKGVLHAHGLTATDAALAGKAPAIHTHPVYALAADLTALVARVAALEAKPDEVTQAEFDALVARVTALETPQPPPAGNSVRVTSIPALLTTLADNTVDEIVVANGTYAVASRQLLIDSRFAGRTKPVTVRAETVGGVTFSGSGATGWVGLHFTEGVHDQTWQGFHFANAEPTQVGVIVFGQSGSVTPVPPHHITLLDITIDETITSGNTYLSGDHAMYFSSTTSPMHDILIDRYTVNAATSGLDDALHFYVQPALGVGPQNVTVSHMTVTGTNQAIVFWDASLSGIVVEDSTITGAINHAVRYEQGGQVTLRNLTSTNSHGFYSSMGANPPGVTFVNCSLQ